MTILFCVAIALGLIAVLLALYSLYLQRQYRDMVSEIKRNLKEARIKLEAMKKYA